MDSLKYCLLDENKICDNCGECDRCDLDPNKICDNCCKCIAMEDEGKEFRSRIVSSEKQTAKPKLQKPASVKKHVERSSEIKKSMTENTYDFGDEPTELTPELIEYWERILIEHGEAPADDGFGEIEVNTRIPVYGSRKAGRPHNKIKDR